MRRDTCGACCADGGRFDLCERWRIVVALVARNPETLACIQAWLAQRVEPEPSASGTSATRRVARAEGER